MEIVAEDVLGSGRTVVGGDSLYSDGEWVWRGDLWFYVTWGAMMLAGGPVPKLDTAVRDAPDGTAFIDSEAQLDVFRTLFRRLETVSLDPGRSRDFIHRLAKEL